MRDRDLHDFRPLVVSAGGTRLPLVCRLNVREILFWHHGSRAQIPVEWREFVTFAAATANLTPEEFLRGLLAEFEQIEATRAPSAETADGRAGAGVG